MGRFSTVALAVVVSAALTVAAPAQIKNVLLEQHTGTWCGWCPDGTVKMDEILALYGDRIIGVKIHNGDGMAIPEQAILAQTLGLTGFPTGSVDRKEFGGLVFLNRGDWKNACEFQMQQRARAEVDCFYTLDRHARVIRIQVLANITADMDLPLRFNAFVVEDDVTGTGAGYDQKNFLCGRAGYEDNPYYDQPAVLVGYHHMKVVRRMLGGAWGVPGDLPAAVKAGELYSHTFEAALDASWNLNKLHFVGLLQVDAPDNKEILNSALAVEDGSLLNRIIDSNTPAARVLPADSNLANTYTLQNNTAAEQTYAVTLSTTDRTPADWSAQFTSGTLELAASGTEPATGQIVVAAGARAELSLTLTIGPTVGLGDAIVTLVLQGAPTITRSRLVTAMSREAKHLLVETGSDYSLRPYLGGTAGADALTVAPSDYLAFADELTDVNLVIWNKGPAGGFSAREIAAIRSVPDVNTFLCGDRLFASLSADDLGYFGLEWLGWSAEGVSPFYTVWLSGQLGDVIAGNLGDHIQGNLIAYYINLVRITDADHVFPIMHFQNDGYRRTASATYPIAAKDAIFAVRSTKNDARMVLLGLSPYVLADETIRQTLVGNILDWLAP